ncbi:MAG: LytTR family DNA-binding domain-containing protein [Bacteroidota bacterium]
MIHNLLDRPFYLEEDNRKNWIKVLSISAFVFFFLYVFQPFQIDEYLGNTFLLVLGYAVVTFVVTTLFVLILPRIFTTWYNPEKWTTAKEIINILGLIFVIGIGNAIYSVQFNIAGSFRTGLVYFELYTFAVAVIPVVFLVLFSEKKDANVHYQLSDEIMQKGIAHHEAQVPATNLFRLSAQNGKDILELDPQQIQYVKSDANYVEVIYQQGADFKRELLRNTLSNIESQLSEQGRFFRCHKSYIVNLEQVERVSGNAQGLKIHLLDLDTIVPVSRKNNAVLKGLLA